uniref:Uncharacterized protein n=1 Tax=Kalanchoe fedtschenkoi TaxID=63787 RepID=A0A7N0VLE1_KALFE
MFTKTQRILYHFHIYQLLRDPKKHKYITSVCLFHWLQQIFLIHISHVAQATPDRKSLTADEDSLIAPNLNTSHPSVIRTFSFLLYNNELATTALLEFSYREPTMAACDSRERRDRTSVNVVNRLSERIRKKLLASVLVD